MLHIITHRGQNVSSSLRQWQCLCFSSSFDTPFLSLVSLYLSKHKNPYTKRRKWAIDFCTNAFSTFHFLPTALSFGSLIEGQSRFPCQSLLPDSQPGSQQNELSLFKHSPTKNLHQVIFSYPLLCGVRLTIRQTGWEFSFIRSHLCACQE